MPAVAALLANRPRGYWQPSPLLPTSSVGELALSHAKAGREDEADELYQKAVAACPDEGQRDGVLRQYEAFLSRRQRDGGDDDSPPSTSTAS